MSNPKGSTPEALRQIFGGAPQSEDVARLMYQVSSVATAIPVLGDFVRARDDWRYMDDYMRNRGLSYRDLKYPSRTVGGSEFRGSVSFVSSNVTKLYRDPGKYIGPRHARGRMVASRWTR